MLTENEATTAAQEERLILLEKALAQLLHEVLEAGFATAKDYNWPKAIAAAKAALGRTD